MRLALKLAQPFDPLDLEWRVQQSGDKNGNPWAMVLVYVTNRAIQQRLDDVCGIFNWKNEFSESPDKGIKCGLSILNGMEWITKYDSAENTNIDAVKGGISGAMKRAAVQWGIGRYLYKLDAVFAECTYKDPKSKEWTRATMKNKKTYWFKVPTLPQWALPTEYVDLDTIDIIEELIKETQSSKEKIYIAYDVEGIDELSMVDGEKIIKQLNRKKELAKAKK